MIEDTKTITLTFTPESFKELERLASEDGTTISMVIANALALYKISKNKTVYLKTPGSRDTLELRRNK